MTHVPDDNADVFGHTDNTAAFGQVYYYRLVQLAQNGNLCVSATERVGLPYVDRGRLSPNPTFGQVRVYSPGTVPREYALYTSLGKLLWRGNINQGSNLIDLSELPAGVYVFVEESGNGELTVERIVRQ